jgi:lipid A 3-O-deacylase
MHTDWRRFLHPCLSGLALAALAGNPAQAGFADDSTLIAIGVFGHDQGPASDHNEHGIDLNLEVRFAPLDFFGSPRPHLGATLNFVGDTSIAYAGLTLPVYAYSNWFVNGSVSAAVHNGPMHKDPDGCVRHSDCGFGVRVLPLFSADIGYRLDDKSAISLFYGHMSHKWIISGENEGLDYTGLRYLRSF